MNPRAKYFVLFLLVFVLSLWLYFFFSTTDANTIYVNAKIYTMDGENGIAEAMAVGGNKIIGIGSRDDIERKFRAPATVDLQGRTVVPGLIDAHAHLLSLGISKLTVDLVGTTSTDTIVQRVKDRVARVEAGQWVRGRGWDQNDWSVKSFPTHRTLDRVSPSNPVYLTRIDGHAAWVNKKALEIAGITRATPDPPGGKIIRDGRGNPTGVLIDAAMRLVSSKMPSISHAEIQEALRLAVAECAALGITTVHDMGVDLEDVLLYQQAIDNNLPMIRIYAAIGGTESTWNHFVEKGPLVGYGEGLLTVRALKLYIDGALGSRGAALIEPYTDDPQNRGLTIVGEQKFRSDVEEALKHGFQVCTHAIGDRGNNIVLNSYEKALATVPSGDYRLRVEHAQVVSRSDIPRFNQLGVLPSMQPTHCTSDMYWAEARLGPERVKGAYAWRSFRDAGSIIPGGSDFPVERPNPIHGIYAAVTRRDLQGHPIDAQDVVRNFQLSPSGISNPADFENGWYVKEKLTREEALRMFTTWAAWSEFAEKEKGSLEKGKFADFVVLSDDIMAVAEDQIPQIHAVMTVVGGKVLHNTIPISD
ncbi:MAG: amidohydrolase [Ignavibacteria bacterium]|nr:amidohydrolase [Ignavibacteria bacterium]